jgi:hypothetical protein
MSNTAVKTILILAANPANTSWLRLDEEVREITTVLQRAKNHYEYEIVTKWTTRVENLRGRIHER